MRLTPILIALLITSVSAQNVPTPAYCRVATAGTEVVVQRPESTEDPIDDVNWFARPVPNPAGHWIVGFASHNQNYLYDLTNGVRVRIPDKSDAVATPDGRYRDRAVALHRERDGEFLRPPTLLVGSTAGKRRLGRAAGVRPRTTRTSKMSITSRWASSRTLCERETPTRPSTG